MDKDYILPNKELLNKSNELFKSDSRFYNLSKMILKKDLNNKLTIPLGIDEKRDKYYMNLESIPTLLISGETGSGKSVFLNSAIVTLLLKNNPNELKFLFFDPKLVELGEFDGISHVIIDGHSNTDGYKIDYALLMLEERKKVLKDAKCKTIDEYNKLYSNSKLAQIIIIADESVDMMKDDSVLDLIKTIMSKGVDYGFHLILATNSYLKNHFNRALLNSFPYIITFDLASEEQAKYLKIQGADLLKAGGEVLIKCRNNDILKMQTPYISDEEIKKVVDFIKEQS